MEWLDTGALLSYILPDLPADESRNSGEAGEDDARIRITPAGMIALGEADPFADVDAAQAEAAWSQWPGQAAAIAALTKAFG